MMKKSVSQPDNSQEELPELFYANSVSVNMGPFDVFMDFAIRMPENPNPRPVARVHMSLQHAWVMAKIIDRLFAQYRQSGGKITIPENVLNELGLFDEYREDWQP